MTMRFTAAFILIVATAASLAAQDIRASLDTTPAAPAATLPNPSSATWMAVGFTVVPVAIDLLVNSSGNGGGLATLGLVVGPASGFWYGGVGGKAWKGLFIRTGGLLVAVIGAAGCVYSAALDSSGCTSGENAFMIAGAAIVVGSAIYDIATVGNKVREHNTQRVRAMIVPLFTPSQRRVGLAVVIGI